MLSDEKEIQEIICKFPNIKKYLNSAADRKQLEKGNGENNEKASTTTTLLLFFVGSFPGMRGQTMNVISVVTPRFRIKS